MTMAQSSQPGKTRSGSEKGYQSSGVLLISITLTKSLWRELKVCTGKKNITSLGKIRAEEWTNIPTTILIWFITTGNVWPLPYENDFFLSEWTCCWTHCNQETNVTELETGSTLSFWIFPASDEWTPTCWNNEGLKRILRLAFCRSQCFWRRPHKSNI